jgi:hypothetical protein
MKVLAGCTLDFSAQAQFVGIVDDAVRLQLRKHPSK